MKDCGKKGHARKDCLCERCIRVRERNRLSAAKYRKENREKLLKSQREYRAKTNNKITKKYEKTPKGFLMRAYRNMKSRTQGIQKQGSWVGKSILSKEEFYEWSWNNSDFWRLFKAYQQSGYELKLCPSVNRIDPRKGYDLDNIEWITQSVNSSLASQTRINKDEQRKVVMEILLNAS